MSEFRRMSEFTRLYPILFHKPRFEYWLVAGSIISVESVLDKSRATYLVTFETLAMSNLSLDFKYFQDLSVDITVPN